MAILKKYVKSRVSRFSFIKRHEFEEDVQNGLSVTPQRMLELTNKGIPISSQLNALVFDEGVSALDFEPPLECTRGVDLADLWEARENLKVKVRKAKQRVASGEIKPIVEQAGA